MVFAFNDNITVVDSDIICEKARLGRKQVRNNFRKIRLDEGISENTQKLGKIAI